MSSTMHEQRVLLRIPEVVFRLNLGRSTVYELIAAGEIPTIRIGRSVRVPAAALDDWVNRQMDAGETHESVVRQ